MSNENRYKKISRKIIYGTIPEERFKEVHGITIEEWEAKGEERFKEKTGMSSEEWYVNKVNSSTPIDYLKHLNGVVSQADIDLIKDLQELGLKDGVINVLLDYVKIVSKIGFIHSLVKEMGESWINKNISTIESAMAFVREEWNN